MRSSQSRGPPRPIRADAQARLVTALSRGRRWLDEMFDGTVKSIEEIAKREHCSVRKVNMTLSLAFLAPDLVKAAIAGCLPRGVGISPPVRSSGVLVRTVSTASHRTAPAGLAEKLPTHFDLPPCSDQAMSAYLDCDPSLSEQFQRLGIAPRVLVHHRSRRSSGSGRRS